MSEADAGRRQPAAIVVVDTLDGATFQRIFHAVKDIEDRSDVMIQTIGEHFG